MTLISLIANELKTQMEDSPHFPFSDRRNYPPSKQFKPHMKNVALRNNPIVMVSPEIEYFEIGNDYAEENAPQYHILEDAKTIRNPNQGTLQSLGSQRTVKEVSKRDYGKMVWLHQGTNTWRGQEYRQSFRGRSNIWKENLRLSTRNFEEKLRKKKGNRTVKGFRYNIHWGYIERILQDITPRIADSINAKLVIGSKLFETYQPIEDYVDLDTFSLSLEDLGEDMMTSTTAPIGE